MKVRQLVQLLASAAFLSLVCLVTMACQEGESPPALEEPVVKVELLSDTAAIEPGAEFMLAAYFELPEHFHIYWENSGESGMPTTVKVKGPEGFEIGEARYPGPKSLEVALDIVSFVYEDKVAIFVPVKAPAELGSSKSFEFQLEAEWLVCRKECFLQEEERSLTLKLHVGEGEPAKANAKRLDPQKENLPRPRADLPELRFRWMGSPPDYRALTVVRGAQMVEFFPGLETNLIISQLVLNPGSNAYELAIDFAATPGQEEDTPLAMGVLRVLKDDVIRFYSVNFSEPVK